MLINDVDAFFEMIQAMIPQEVELTDTYEGKVFALAEKENEGTHITMIPISVKNFDNKINLFREVENTKEQINSFHAHMLHDGLTPLAYCHTELFIVDNRKRIVYLAIKIQNGERNLVEQKQFKIETNETFIDADGSIVEGKTKCIEVEIK